MKQFSITTIFVLLASYFGLSACGAPTPSPAPPNDIPPISESIQPVASPTLEAGIDVSPTPDPDLGIVTGVLLQNQAAPEPADLAILYLAKVLLNDQGTPALASFDRNTSVGTQTDADGRFVFMNVQPGVYSLVLDRIYDSFLLRDPQDSSDFLIDVRAGESVDLGDLIYTQLPGFSP